MMFPFIYNETCNYIGETRVGKSRKNMIHRELVPAGIFTKWEPKHLSQRFSRHKGSFSPATISASMLEKWEKWEVSRRSGVQEMSEQLNMAAGLFLSIHIIINSVTCNVMRTGRACLGHAPKAMDDGLAAALLLHYTDSPDSSFLPTTHSPMCYKLQVWRRLSSLHFVYKEP